MSKGVIWTLFLLFTLSISSCDNTDIAKTQGGLKTKCPVSDPLGLLEKTPECEANTDDPLNLIPSQSTEILVQNLATIAEAASVLEVCLLSEAYLQIDSDLALSLSDMSARLGKLAETITYHYNDENMYLSYQLVVAEQSTNSETVKFASDKYGPCSNALLADLVKFANRSEKLLNSL